MCTKTGITTFKIITGTAFKTHTMSCKNAVTDAKFIEALPAPIAVPGTPVQQYFKVTDRWGNPVAGATVRFSSTGPGSVTNLTDSVSWNDGIVTAEATSADAGTQVITATILEGKAKTYVNVTLPAQVFVKKYAKGKHTLKITVGTVVKTVTVTVP